MDHSRKSIAFILRSYNRAVCPS